jgi:branched-chain amino acid transport system ATP-binding protein
MAALEVEHVHTGYGDIRVVRDVSLTAEAGSISVLLGRNGVGKTTTLLAVAGLLSASSGQVSLHGRDITRARAEARVRAGLGFVQEGKRVFRDRTVDENLLLGAFTVRAGRKAWRRSIEEAYERFPLLREKRSEVAGRLSGGQQQMLAIGRALMANPDLLILDEPSEGLAPVIVDELASLFVRLGAEGMGILLIEQNVSLIHRVANRFYALSKGTVAESGSLENVSREELTRHLSI